MFADNTENPPPWLLNTVFSYHNTSQNGVSHMQVLLPNIWTMLENGVRISFWSGFRASLVYNWNHYHYHYHYHLPQLGWAPTSRTPIPWIFYAFLMDSFYTFIILCLGGRRAHGVCHAVPHGVSRRCSGLLIYIIYIYMHHIDHKVVFHTSCIDIHW